MMKMWFISRIIESNLDAVFVFMGRLFSAGRFV